jgi:hypothetical protein
MSAVTTGDPLTRLRSLLAREGEAIAPVLSADRGEEVVAPVVAACARSRPDAAELALVMESILEGYLLHYGQARLVVTADEDLRLLAGDHLYALGLSRLAQLGDLDAVRALADLITACARAHAEGRPQAAVVRVAAGLWLLTALVVGAGRWPGYEQAFAAGAGGESGADRLVEEALGRAAALGVEIEAKAALIAFGRAVADRATPSNSGNFSP